MLTVFYFQDRGLSDSESEDECDWEEEFLKLGEEEKGAIQKEQEEENFHAEVLRNQRSSDIKAQQKAASWRDMGLKEGATEEKLCEDVCFQSSELPVSDDGMVVDASKPTAESERPTTPSAEDSEWGRSSLNYSSGTKEPKTPSPMVSP